MTGPQYGHIIMTMKASPSSIPAGQFKARCLALLDRIARTGEAVTVTKWGRPVATVVPARPRRVASLRGSISVKGDIVAPLGERWDATA